MANTLVTGFTREAVEQLSRSKGEPEWMLQKRLEAWEIYEKTPAPLGRRGDLGTRRMFANFKFSDLNPYVPAESNGALPAAIEQSLQEALVDQRAGLIMQRNASVVKIELDEELKSQGVVLTDLDTAVREYPELVQQHFMTSCVPVDSSKYTALHAAFWSGGIFLYIPKGVIVEDPILGQVWLDAPGSATFAHTLIIADDESSVRYVEEHNSAFESDTPSLLNSVIEVYTKNAAHVEFSNLQDLGQNVWTITNRNAVHEKDGSTTWVMADLGSRAMLSNIGVGLLGNGSAGELVGVFFTDHDQRYSINTLSDHAAIATNAETLVKGVLTDESRVEFDGMIRVRPKAQQTASFLSDHTLLLSDKCRAESIPGLEIGANEVSASHGATTGKIDEEQLFYLMVRGIPREEAERIIVQGFFEPVLQRIPLENLRARLRRSIVRRMRGAYETEADTWVDAQETWEIEGVDEYAVSLDGNRDDEEIRLTEY
ncbi:MAG TPA: Fe-S cluster assembly protein SufD [Ktedonobacteraceae bacterium]|jgi:Fe-S cluster assembly protein SufD|nr:Fe-S cluster assembly protein SufD [Ktedonobacteraceae bacterium]